jgi:uncharacterized protein with ParB-like and HNH nuclease domain
MHADAVALHKVLNSNLQMIIPIFQRPYSWEKEQVRTLWEDILKLYDNVNINTKATHFLGPIVRVGISTSSVDTMKLYLIDGQQRIITLMVLLACMRNRFRGKDDNIVRKIESGYLLNYEEKEENHYKLIPSEGDRDVFKKIIKGEDLGEGRNKLKDTFEFFNKRLENSDFDLEKLRGIIINNLILVNIDVDKEENPYLIFESLNAKGTSLTQADLIRNYIFMKIGNEDKQRELYREFWRPMEESLGSALETFFWRYSLKDGSFVKIQRTYANLKSEFETNNEKNAEDELKKLNLYSKYYKRLIEPKYEPNPDLGKRFNRHNRWEIRTEYPFLLNIYKDYVDSHITLRQFCEILDIIESFVVRRFFCRYPTNKLNTLFIGLYRNLDKQNMIVSLKKILFNDCPNDDQFKEGLINFPIYLSGTEKTSLILETIEESFHHKEPVKMEKLQIEHIMPQSGGDAKNLSQDWKNILGDNYESVYSKYLHTLGNLTSTGYNPELGMKSFDNKKRFLRDSHLELNKYFENINSWNEAEIIKRAETLAKIALNVWRNLKDAIYE